MIIKKRKITLYIRTLPIKEREYQTNLKDIKKGFEDAALMESHDISH